jgi:hypothetical protein
MRKEAIPEQMMLFYMKHLAMLLPYERLRLLDPTFYSVNVERGVFGAWKEVECVPYVAIPIQANDSWLLIFVNASNPKVIQWGSFYNSTSVSAKEILDNVSKYFKRVFRDVEVQKQHFPRPRNQFEKSSLCLIAEFEKIASAVKTKEVICREDVLHVVYYEYEQLSIDAEIISADASDNPIRWCNYELGKKTAWWPCVLVPSRYHIRLRTSNPSKTLICQAKRNHVAWFNERPGEASRMKPGRLDEWTTENHNLYVDQMTDRHNQLDPVTLKKFICAVDQAKAAVEHFDAFVKTKKAAIEQAKATAKEAVEQMYESALRNNRRKRQG